MADRPILFSGPMIRALLAGRKTQTRRILKPQPHPCFKPMADPSAEAVRSWCRTRKIAAPGDRLWVRETLRFAWESDVQGEWRYDADKASLQEFCCRTLETPTPDRWPLGFAPSIHMPRWASRITCPVEDVKVERLQDISEADARAEGIYPERIAAMVAAGTCDWGEPIAVDDPIETFSIWPGADCSWATARQAFESLWGYIHGPDAWNANPWVAASTFRVVNQNIDALGVAHEPR